MMMISPSVCRRIFVRNSVANVRGQTGRGVRLMGRRRLRLMRMWLLLRRRYVGMQRLRVRRVTAVGAVSVRVVMTKRVGITVDAINASSTAVDRAIYAIYAIYVKLVHDRRVGTTAPGRQQRVHVISAQTAHCSHLRM